MGKIVKAKISITTYYPHQIKDSPNRLVLLSLFHRPLGLGWVPAHTTR